MNLHALLEQRAAQKKPLRVALIGAGKFGSMFLSRCGARRGCTSPRYATSRPSARARV